MSLTTATNSYQQADISLYRKKLGLDFDKFIELHPEVKDAEELFRTFMVRYDLYKAKHKEIMDKFAIKEVEADSEKELNRIDADRLYALLQLENVYVDVIRVQYGINPADDNALLGFTASDRYIRLIGESRRCKEFPGFYMGDDGLLRLEYFHAFDSIPLKTYLDYAYLNSQGRVYRVFENDLEDVNSVELFIGGIKIEIPPCDENTHLNSYLPELADYLIASVDEFGGGGKSDDKTQTLITDFVPIIKEEKDQK